METLKWFWIDDPAGFAAFLLLAGIPLSLILSAVLLRRYRRSVLRSMEASAGSGEGADEDGAPAPAASVSPLRLVNFEDRQAEAQDLPGLLSSALLRRARTRRAIVVAGLVHTGLAALLLLWSSGIAFSPLRFAALWMVLAWPIVPSAAYVSVGDRRLRILAPVLFLAAGCAIFWASTGVPPTQFAFLALWLGGIPMALALLVSNRRVRAVGPISLAVVVLLLIAVNLAMGLSLAVMRAVDFLPAGLVIAALAGLSLVGALLGGRAILRRLARRYLAKQTSDQLLLLNVWWSLYSVWISMLIGLGWGLGGLAGLVPLFAYAAVLRWQLAPSPDRPEPPPISRLLLLRVFGFRRRSEQMLGSIGRLWRYLGPVELIAGPDLATANLEPHEILEFLGGRLSRQFVSGREDLERRLSARDDLPDPDGCYRVHEFFCHDDTWRLVLRCLSRDADVVLMDLRSFSQENRGCEYELQQLVRSVQVGRILLLVDGTTDVAYLRQILEQEWARLPVDSANAGQADSELRMLRLDRDDVATSKRMISALGGMARAAA